MFRLLVRPFPSLLLSPHRLNITLLLENWTSYHLTFSFSAVAGLVTVVACILAIYLLVSVYRLLADSKTKHYSTNLVSHLTISLAASRWNQACTFAWHKIPFNWLTQKCKDKSAIVINFCCCNQGGCESALRSTLSPRRYDEQGIFERLCTHSEVVEERGKER